MKLIQELIEATNIQGIRDILSERPELANEGIPFDEQNLTKAHPLHRLCDGVFNKYYTDDEAVAMAKVFLEFGANIDGDGLVDGQDTPLIAASSLHADEVALLYIDHGATIQHAGCNGGTALHWAAWCGRDKVVKRLIAENAEINRRCTEFNGTPLLWAIHGYKFGGGTNRHHQIECARLLLQAGADKQIPNGEGESVLDFLEGQDQELIDLLSHAAST